MSQPQASLTEPNWHALPVETVFSILGSDRRDGLSRAEVQARLEQFGPNELSSGQERRWTQLIVDQFRDMVIWVLLAAMGVALTLGETADALVILTIVLLNAFLGVIQEWKAEQALAALRRTTVANARVLREGQEREVPSVEIVPGDLVLLEAGNAVPADLRLIETKNLQLEEAALTGESAPVEKNAEELLPEDAPAADRVNMAFSTTLVVAGRGVGMVAATGARTEVGAIARMLEGIREEQTPLQRHLEGLGKTLALLVLGVCVVVFVAGVLRGFAPVSMLLTAVSLAVAAIPEGLPAAVTVVLAMGVRNMVQRHAIVRRLRAVEALGSTTVICTDKTGTLTQNVMTVRRLWVAEREVWLDQASETGGDASKHQIGQASIPVAPDLHRLLEIAVLCNDARLPRNGSDTGIGDPTETSLLQFAATVGVTRDELEARMPRQQELPFDSDRKRMATVHLLPKGGYRVMVKGAPDGLLRLCSQLYLPAGSRDLSSEDRQALAEAIHQFAAEGMRLLGFAYRDLTHIPNNRAPEVLEQNLVFVGLAGIIDPPRAEATEAVRTCRAAGIRPVMITGDHPDTAQAIAREVAIAETGDRLFSGEELRRISDSELQEQVRRVSLYARVSPADKLRIVNALQARGEIVAMTGDGVNDAPALKQAQIGVAMGRTGTEVARGAADIVLTDDNFASIVAAVEEGRRIFDNIRKFVLYLLSCNFSEILTLFLAILIGLPQPLLAVQILWINLVTDGLPALALGMEPKEPDLMRRPPRDPSSGVLNRRTLQEIVRYGSFLTLGSLTAFGYGLYQFCLAPQHLVGLEAVHAALQPAFWLEPRVAAGLEKARTLTFGTLAFSQLGHALNCRSERHSVLTLGLWSNPWLLIAVAISALAQLAALHTPLGHTLFHTVPISGMDLCVAIGLSVFPLVLGEITKQIRIWRS